MEVELDEIRPEELQQQGREPVSLLPGVGGRGADPSSQQRLDLSHKASKDKAVGSAGTGPPARLDQGMVRRESSDPVGRAELFLGGRMDVRRSETGLARVEMCMARHRIGRGCRRPRGVGVAEQGPSERPIAEEVEVLLAVRPVFRPPFDRRPRLGRDPSKRPSDRASPR